MMLFHPKPKFTNSLVLICWVSRQKKAKQKSQGASKKAKKKSRLVDRKQAKYRKKAKVLPKKAKIPRSV